MKSQKVRQTLKTKLSMLVLAGFILCTLQSCAQNSEKKPSKKTKPDYSKVDYSKKSNIIKYPEKLTGDKKAIFHHPYFLKLTSKQAKNLDPLKVKREFAKLGITTKENDRFLDAYSFFLSDIVSHKKSCQNWESFKDLAPNKN